MASQSKYLNDKELHELLKPYAYKAIKDLSEVSHSAIQQFYDDYTPGTYVKSGLPEDIYKRTFGIKNMFKSEMKRTSKGYDVIFTYSPHYFTTQHRSDEAVFSHSFLEGLHGGAYYYGHMKDFIPSMTPSPWDIISSFAGNYDVTKKY